MTPELSVGIVEILLSGSNSGQPSSSVWRHKSNLMLGRSKGPRLAFIDNKGLQLDFFSSLQNTNVDYN